MNQGGLYTWSQTANANSSSDATVNWAEGQAPSSINDSARAMMASAAKYRDDISGAIVTTGTSTAYAVTSYQVFDSLTDLNGKMIAFTPHTGNGQTVTLNVDGLGAKPLRTAPGTELVSGTILTGTPYVCTFNNTDGAFYLQSFFGNPYSIPVGAGLDYWGSTTPSSNFAFPTGQAISRTTYATLFALVGTTYGTGDGSSTFNLPDKTGRVSVGSDPGGTRVTTNTFNATTIGGVGGHEILALTAAQIPSITSSNPSAIALSVTTSQKVLNGPNQGSATAGGSQVTAADSGSGGALSLLGSTGNIAIGAAAVTSTNTAGNAHANVQPSIVCNYILRII